MREKLGARMFGGLCGPPRVDLTLSKPRARVSDSALAQLFAKMGLADVIKAKAVLVPGGLVAERVASGEAELGIHQISEILAVPGVTLVGPLPAEIQNYTVYAGGVAAGSHEGEAARGFLAALSGPRGLAVLTEKGMEPAGS